MMRIKKEQEYGEKLRKYFFAFIGCFIGFAVLVFITDLEPRIFFTGFVLLATGFIGFIIYFSHVVKKLTHKSRVITAKNINDLKLIAEDNQKYTEKELLEILNAIAAKKSTTVDKSGSSIFDYLDDRNRRLDRLDRTLGTSFRSPVWSHRRETK
jgi:hypothetical protein